MLLEVKVVIVSVLDKEKAFEQKKCKFSKKKIFFAIDKNNLIKNMKIVFEPQHTNMFDETCLIAQFNANVIKVLSRTTATGKSSLEGSQMQFNNC